MQKIKVLVVDDSILIRKFISDMINSDPELETCGSAPNGKIALGKIPFFSPDVITLDIEMPEMNGIETLKEIRKLYPKLPVIMVSSLSIEGAKDTFNAIELGANDFITKPSEMSEKDEIIKYLLNTLNPKLKFWGNKNGLLKSNEVYNPITVIKKENQSHEIVIIGISTGGTIALMEVLPKFPKDFPLPIIVVIHIPALFSKSFAERLKEVCMLNVKEAEHNEQLLSGTIYLAPGDFHLEIAKRQNEIIIQLNQESRVNFCRPSVDVMFQSVAEIYKEKTLGVIMTGMGRDGLDGCRLIQKYGGTVFIQDKETSVVWGMPGAIANEELANKILPLEKITENIIKSI